MDIRERIIVYLSIKSITKYRFYQLTGLSNGFLDKNSSISSKNCQKICNAFPDLNPVWLVMGVGEMYKKSTSELVEVDKNRTI